MRTTWMLGAAVCLLSGCGKDPAPPASAPASPAAPAAGTAPAAAGATATPTPTPTTLRLTLLEPGAEPRRTLRYHPKAGTKVDADLVTTQKNRTGDDPHLTVQTTTMALDSEILSVDAAGVARTRLRMHDLRMEMQGQPTAAGVNEALEGLRMHFETNISPTGAVSGTEAGIDADPSGQLSATMKPMMESLGQTMNQVSVQLPPEPVGVGARWKVEGPLTVLGMTMTTTTTMTIEAIDGDRVTLKSTTGGSGSEQKMTMAGIDSDIHSMSTEGGGTYVMDLTKTVAATMEMSTKSKVKMTVHVPNGPARDMNVDSTMEMKLTSKK